MFARHRKDLIDAQERTIKAMQDSIMILVDQVEYLRAQVDGKPHVSMARVAVNPTNQPPAEEGFKKYLSEEEEEAMALHLNGHISDAELADLRMQFNMPSLEPDA